MLLTAYHESARVVFAYLNGYACDLMEVPAKGSNSNTKLNAGSDITVVQAVLGGNPLSLPTGGLQQGIEVAKKLLTVYCAGTCAKIFYQNDLQIPAELEIDISGQDLTMIEKIQTFLKKAIVDHPDDFPSQIMISVFRKLKDPDVWKAIELLASKVLKEDGTLKRYYIEDTLMVAGMSIRKPSSKPASGIGLHEDDSVKTSIPDTKATPFEAPTTTPLDIMVKDFLKKIKSDWKEEELNAAIAYLHNVYKKYG
ncbi:MAG: hypothetical protein JWQ40_1581 [Segetibacter sp.]|nr:hypothetical protein [Segetibacter sp.]